MRVSLLFLTVLILFSGGHAHSQTVDPNNLITITYDGNYLWCAVAQIDVINVRGNYIITNRGGGVVRFDPVSEEFILFQCPEPLIKNDVHKIVTDGDGRIWLRYDQSSQITVFDGINWGHHQLSGKVNDIAVDGEGTLWAGTDNGLFSLADSGWVCHSEHSTLTKVYHLTVDGYGILTAAGDSPSRASCVVLRLEDDTWNLLGGTEYEGGIYNVVSSENGDVWSVYYGGLGTIRVTVFPPKDHQDYHYPDLDSPLKINPVHFTPLRLDENNNAWILFHYEPIYDGEDTLLVETTDIVAYLDSTVVVYAPEEAPPYVLYDWTHDKNGVKWIATQQGLVRYDGTNYRTIVVPPKVVEDPKPLPLELKAYPNPFNNEITVLVNLDTGAFTELSIYSINGQKICTLSETTLSAGQHSFKWDGRDDIGGTVSSGIYLIRMNARANGITRKVVFLK